MTRKWIILSLLMALSFPLWSQQDIQVTQFFWNKLPLNPAYAGSRDALSFIFLARNQWTGFKGAPRTQTFGGHSPILHGSSGVGVSLLHDKLGYQNRQMLNASYAYRIQLNWGTLALGVSGQVNRMQMDWNAAQLVDPNDPEVPFSYNTLVLPNAGAGLYLNTEYFYVGLSVPHLLENKLDFDPSANGIDNLGIFRRHYYGMAGIIFRLSDALKLKPALLVKAVQNAPVQVDAHTSLIYKDMLWLGATYRAGDAFSASIQYTFKKYLRVGYSYDFSVTKLSAYHAGTHEIMLGFDLVRTKGGYYHPRYF